LTFFDLERNKFTERVFGIFDEDGSGCVDFKEFVVALWNYCTLTHSTLGKWQSQHPYRPGPFLTTSSALFAFDLYDKDSSGIIDSNEVKLMLKEIYGSNYTQNVHATRFLSPSSPDHLTFF
jgi:Ca2+-binding EF-hand superfamily protein